MAKPVILLGLDNAQLGVSSTNVQSSDKNPVAVKTKMGWVAYGPTNFLATSPPMVLHIREKQYDELHDMIVADNFGTTAVPTILESEDNRRARQILEETTHRVGERFETGLLWKSHQPTSTLPNSFKMAERRLLGIERKMSHDADFANRYKLEMSKYLEKEYARKLSEKEVQDVSQPVWYLPHFAVQSPHKPVKLRIVFDAAANVNGISLNSVLLKGPEQAKPLLGILFKFRQGVIGVAGSAGSACSEVFVEKWRTRKSR